MKKLLVFFVLLLSLASCGKKSENKEQHSQTDEKQEITEEPSIYIESIYATSIKLPHKKFGPRNLFDNDPTTIWQTMSGAGPDEGIFLSFEEPVFIKGLRLKLPAEGKPDFSKFRLYINGSETSDFHINQNNIKIEKQVKTLYVRIIASSVDFSRYSTVRIADIELTGKDNEVLKLNAVNEVKGSIIASSSLDPYESYNVDFLFDSRKDFGWADGNSDKSGSGEFLKFNFNDEVTIEKIKIWNGYQRSAAHYKANERVKSISFGAVNADMTDYEVKDTAENIIELKTKVTGKSFILTVNDVYKGRDYKDLVISELRFFNGKEWFIINSWGMEIRKRELLSNSKAPLKGLLDRRLSSVFVDTDLFMTQSLILRSNGSFILWFLEETPTSSLSRYADGNWQQTEENRIKIFGKIHTLQKFTDESEYDYYASRNTEEEQPEDQDSIKIFNDFLTIDPTVLSSRKELFKPFEL